MDVWELGILWYSIMANELLFDGASVLTITTGLTLAQRTMIDERAEKLGYLKEHIEVVKICLVDDPTEMAM